ncbi:MAG: PEPxxWA-CTERM sorting domain-containing protein [Burkholderiales bacterium]
MQIQWKVPMAAVVLAASGPALADIANGDTGNGELFLSVFDPANNVSYVRDLNVFMNDFGTANRSTGGFTTNVDLATAPTALRFASAADAVWGQFVAGKSNDVVGQFVYDVVALDNNGGGSADGLRFLTTSSSALNWATTTGNQQNNASITQFQGTNAYINSANLTLGGDNSVGGSALFGPGSAAFMFESTSGKFDNWGTFSKFRTTGAIGSSLDFYYITRSSNTAAAEGIAVKYGNALGSGQWLLSANGDLAFTAPVPVPEPETYALMLAGIGLVGAIARRRRA